MPEPSRNPRAGWPAWSISLGLHSLLLLLLSLVVVAFVRTPEEAPVEAALDDRTPPAADTPPRPLAEPPRREPTAELPEIARRFERRALELPGQGSAEAPVPVSFAGSAGDASAALPARLPLSEALGLEGGEFEFPGEDAARAPRPGPGGTVAPGFGQRLPGSAARLPLRDRNGGSDAADAAVGRALEWLAGHQSHDTNGGFWDCGKYGGRHITHPEVKPEDRMSYDVAVTGLAVLAFLGAGHTTTDPKYGKVVTDALYWLEAHQDPKTGRWPGSHYGQGIASLAAAEAFGMGCGHQEMAQKALNYVRSAQNPEGGWNYYTTNRDRNDTSITGWQVMAAKSARIAELEVPDALFEDARKHFKNVMGASGETAGGGDWKIVYAREKNLIHTNDAAGPDAIGAITVLSLLYMGMSPQDPVVLKAAEYFKNRKPNILNLYYTYYGTLAMFQVGGEYWQAWNKEMHDPLIQAQVKGRGEDDGSWDYQNDAWGPGGGRVYTTAMAAMTLEVYYRYLPLYR